MNSTRCASRRWRLPGPATHWRAGSFSGRPSAGKSPGIGPLRGSAPGWSASSAGRQGWSLWGLGRPRTGHLVCEVRRVLATRCLALVWLPFRASSSPLLGWHWHLGGVLRLPGTSSGQTPRHRSGESRGAPIGTVGGRQCEVHDVESQRSRIPLQFWPGHQRRAAGGPVKGCAAIVGHRWGLWFASGCVSYCRRLGHVLCSLFTPAACLEGMVRPLAAASPSRSTPSVTVYVVGRGACVGCASTTGGAWRWNQKEVARSRKARCR